MLASSLFATERQHCEIKVAYICINKNISNILICELRIFSYTKFNSCRLRKVTYFHILHRMPDTVLLFLDKYIDRADTVHNTGIVDHLYRFRLQIQQMKSVCRGSSTPGMSNLIWVAGEIHIF